jgi:hypothetical protein
LLLFFTDEVRKMMPFPPHVRCRGIGGPRSATMKPACRSTMVCLISAILILGTTSRLAPSLSAAPAGHPGHHLQQYGDVVLRDLPRATPQRAHGKALPFHATNDEEFARGKSSRTAVEVPKASAPVGSALVSITDAGFDGVTFNEAGALPPDTQIAVGPNHVFEAVNDWVRIWSRTSPPTDVYDVDLGSFFGVGFFTTLTDIVSDPRVVYDPASGRWFVSCVTLETLLNTAEWRLAVSKTSDPTGAYTLYAASFTAEFPDFPSLGVSDDKVALTGDAFTMPPDASAQFLGSEFLVASKADVVAGKSAPADTYFGHPQAVDTIQAAVSLSSTSTLYLAAVPADGQSATLQVWSITGVPGVGPGVTVTTKALTQKSALVIPPDADQPNSTIAIATNDVRLLNLVYRNGALWMGNTVACTPAGDTQARACLHFAQVDTTSLTIAQEMTFGEAGIDEFYPAVSVDAAGNMVTVFNRSSLSEFPSVYTSGHNAADAPGSIQTPTLVHAGVESYDPSPYDPRWGDYSGIAVDPFDGGASVWVAGEYVRADSAADWGTWIAKVSSGSSCALPSTPTGLTATAGTAQVALTWNASAGATGYNVKRLSQGTYSTIASVSATSYTDTGLTNGTTYSYVVSATNGCGETANSTPASATPVAAQPPAAPTNLKATGQKRRITLSWTQSSSSGVTANRIYRSQTNGGPYTLLKAISPATTYTDSGLTTGTTWYYVVTAVSGGGESPYSNQAAAKVR